MENNVPSYTAKHYEEPTPMTHTARNVAWVVFIAVMILLIIQLFSRAKSPSVEKVTVQSTGTVITGTTAWYQPEPELTGYALDITSNQEQQTRVMILDASLQKRRLELVAMLKSIDANIDINNKQLVALRAKLAEINTTNYYTDNSFR